MLASLSAAFKRVRLSASGMARQINSRSSAEVPASSLGCSKCRQSAPSTYYTARRHTSSEVEADAPAGLVDQILNFVRCQVQHSASVWSPPAILLPSRSLDLFVCLRSTVRSAKMSCKQAFAASLANTLIRESGRLQLVGAAKLECHNAGVSIEYLRPQVAATAVRARK